MPPGGGHHYRPNYSNPFNNFPQSHQPSHYQNYNNHHGSHTNHNFQHNQPPNIFNNPLSNGLGSVINDARVNGGLAGPEAQMRFPAGSQMHDNGRHYGAAQRIMDSPRIREVYRHNLEQEMGLIRELVDKYPYISMDTEFPGVVARPMGQFNSKQDYHYQTLRCNVDLLKLIQLGVTLWTPQGELPPHTFPETNMNRFGYQNNMVMCPCSWTFNFQFNIDVDMYSQSSVDMLRSSGVDFEKNATHGIDPKEFGSLLISSGLVLQENVTWLSFHSGYDFGYLVKLMLPSPMPNDDKEYIDMIRVWFRNIYDIKYLWKYAQRLHSRGILGQQAANIINNLGLRSGLQDLADELGCVREGRPHTAGSDAWLTGQVFWSLRQKVFDGNIPEDTINMIWGLSPGSAGTGGHGPALADQASPNQNGAVMYQTDATPTTFKTEAGPSTPQAGLAGLASTPGPHGGMYHNNGTGAFGNFQYGR